MSDWKNHENSLQASVRQLKKYLACAALVVLISIQNFVLANDVSSSLITNPVIHPRSVTAENESAKLPLCTLNLKLTGTITGTTKQALISVNGHKDEPFSINQVITDKVILVDVYSRGAVIRRNGILEKLELRRDTSLEVKVRANNGSNSTTLTHIIPSISASGAPPKHDEMNQNQSKISNMTKPKFMGIPFEPTDLFTQAKIVSEADGLQIIETVPGGLYEHLGLQGGDKILTINGEAVDSPLDVMSLSQKNDNTNKTQSTIMRHGNLYSVVIDPANGIEFKMITDPAQIEP